DKLKTFGERSRLGMRLFFLHVFTIDPILADQPPAIRRMLDDRFGHFECRQLTFPRIAFVASDGLPCRILGMIRRPAGLPVVVMIAYQMGMDAASGHHARHGTVERLERTPPAVQEIKPSSMQVAACRHARHPADPGLVERYGALRKPCEIRTVNPFAA